MDLGPLVQEHAKARMRRDGVPPSGWLAMHPANRALRLSGATFRRRPEASVDGDEVVQVRGTFASAQDAAGRVEVRWFAATGDPLRALERLLSRVGVHVG
jgi:hypothetical protein